MSRIPPVPGQRSGIRLKYKPLYHLHERSSDRGSPGDRPSLQQREPLPHLATLGIVLCIGPHRPCQLSDSSFGSEPEVDPKHGAFTGLFSPSLREGTRH